MLDKHQKYSNKFDYYPYIWYRYHRLFFHSLYLGVENYELLIFSIIWSIN